MEAVDGKGEPIHQTLMAKKMEKLDASTDFRPFKFRIQAFTSAFAEKLAALGYSEDELSVRKVRQYLWAQPYISRFNDDGKKSKVSDLIHSSVLSRTTRLIGCFGYHSLKGITSGRSKPKSYPTDDGYSNVSSDRSRESTL